MKRKRLAICRLIAALSAAALMLAACGGSAADDVEDNNAAEGSTETPAEAGDSASPEINEGDAEAESANFYDGDNVTLLIPYGPGGGTDTFVRAVLPFLEEYVPGDVTFTIDNVPGAGSVEGANEFYNERPSDGYTFMVGSASTTLNWILDTPGVNYDFRDMQPLMAWQANAVQYVRSDTGIETWEDILDYDGTLTYAGISPTGGELIRLLAFYALGEETDLDVDVIFGYEDRGSIQIAFEQGEVNMDSSTSFSYAESILPMVEAGDVTPVSTHGFFDTATGQIVRDPSYSELPTLPEVFEELTGEATEAELWDAYRALVLSTNNIQGTFFAHSDAPEGAVEAMITGMERMQEDPDFQAFIDENVGYPVLTGEPLDAAIAARNEILTDDLVAWIKNHLNEVYDQRL